MNNKPSVVDVVDKLLALGGVHHIALYLAAEGITGRINAANACPIASYIQRETGDERVATTGETVFASSDEDETIYAFVDTTGTAVHAFVNAFDAGDYPTLIARELERLEQEDDDA